MEIEKIANRLMLFAIGAVVCFLIVDYIFSINTTIKCKDVPRTEAESREDIYRIRQILSYHFEWIKDGQ